MLDVEAEAATAALHPAHTYVPWVTVNGIPLGAAYVYLKTIVCAAYTGERCDLTNRGHSSVVSMDSLTDNYRFNVFKKAAVGKSGWGNWQSVYCKSVTLVLFCSNEMSWTLNFINTIYLTNQACCGCLITCM